MFWVLFIASAYLIVLSWFRFEINPASLPVIANFDIGVSLFIIFCIAEKSSTWYLIPTMWILSDIFPILVFFNLKAEMELLDEEGRYPTPL